MAGHSKWANIKHKKAREDAKKGKIWSKCSRAIMAAAKNGGGDPETNIALRYAIDEAKSANMPKDNIEYAIKRGTGEAAGAASFEEVRYEGYGPGGVAMMVDGLTDNRNRTASEVRKIFDRHNGNLGESGCVSFQFEKKGQIFLPKTQVEEESLMDTALEAGAQDVADEDEYWLVTTDPQDFMSVKEAIDTAGLEPESASVTMVPLNTVQCAGEDAEKVLKLIDALEDNDDVQNVYANFEIPDEVMATLDQ
jgi:YebC/PmpR family DNA-binding regulatory protein